MQELQNRDADHGGNHERANEEAPYLPPSKHVSLKNRKTLQVKEIVSCFILLISISRSIGLMNFCEMYAYPMRLLMKKAVKKTTNCSYVLEYKQQSGEREKHC